MDLLKTENVDLEQAFTRFKTQLPQHPYSLLNYHDVQLALNGFFTYFPELLAFQKKDTYRNRSVLTSLGKLKPCIGIWKTIFHDFDKLTVNSNVVLIDFVEFNGSTTYLILKGLQENFAGNYHLLRINLSELVDLQKYLSIIEIATLFENTSDLIERMAEMILNELVRQFPQLSPRNISYFLFPPVMGILQSQQILTSLEERLTSPCFEMVALSPSIMANRMINLMEKRVAQLNISLNKGWILEEISFQCEECFELTFRNQKGEEQIKNAKFIVPVDWVCFSIGTFRESRIL